MDTLVTCPCGHTLASHDTEGCFGERLRHCHCRRNRTAALEAAIGAVQGDAVPVPAPAARFSGSALKSALRVPLTHV